MREFEIITNVILSNCQNEEDLQKAYIKLTNEIDNLVINRQKELGGEK